MSLLHFLEIPEIQYDNFVAKESIIKKNKEQSFLSKLLFSNQSL